MLPNDSLALLKAFRFNEVSIYQNHLLMYEILFFTEIYVGHTLEEVKRNRILLKPGLHLCLTFTCHSR